MNIFLLIAAIVVGTWNGNWFPSGRAEHRGTEAEEASTIAAAGKMIGEALRAMDGTGEEDVLLCLNEIRGPRVAMRLAEATGRTNLVLAAISGYRRRDRFDQQQDAILTTLPVVSKAWSLWRREKGVFAPRGYAMAKVAAAGRELEVYAIHLKSNYGATSEALRRENRVKRSLAVRQLLQVAKSPYIIAGDMNADCWSKAFAEEEIFKLFDEKGCLNVLALLPDGKRATHPNRRHGDSALDYIFLNGLSTDSPPRIFSARGVSDHDLVLVKTPGPTHLDFMVK